MPYLYFPMLLECKEERVSYLAIAFCELLLPASNRKLHQDEDIYALSLLPHAFGM